MNRYIYPKFRVYYYKYSQFNDADYTLGYFFKSYMQYGPIIVMLLLNWKYLYYLGSAY